jgi:hypothetical protein
MKYYVLDSDMAAGYDVSMRILFPVGIRWNWSTYHFPTFVLILFRLHAHLYEHLQNMSNTNVISYSICTIVAQCLYQPAKRMLLNHLESMGVLSSL